MIASTRRLNRRLRRARVFFSSLIRPLRCFRACNDTRGAYERESPSPYHRQFIGNLYRRIQEYELLLNTTEMLILTSRTSRTQSCEFRSIDSNTTIRITMCHVITWRVRTLAFPISSRIDLFKFPSRDFIDISRLALTFHRATFFRPMIDKCVEQRINVRTRFFRLVLALNYSEIIFAASFMERHDASFSLSSYSIYDPR